MARSKANFTVSTSRLFMTSILETTFVEVRVTTGKSLTSNAASDPLQTATFQFTHRTPLALHGAVALQAARSQPSPVWAHDDVHEWFPRRQRHSSSKVMNPLSPCKSEIMFFAKTCRTSFEMAIRWAQTALTERFLFHLPYKKYSPGRPKFST